MNFKTLGTIYSFTVVLSTTIQRKFFLYLSYLQFAYRLASTL